MKVFPKFKIEIGTILAYLISFLFHPLFVPFYTVVLYFYISPRFFIIKNIRFLEAYLLIVSIIIPLLFFITLKYSGLFKSILIESPRERLFFSWIMLVVYLIILNKIVKYYIFIELAPFFLGISLALIWISLCNYYYKKPSLHALALGGMLTFLMIWSYYSEIFLLPVLSLLIIIASVVLAARIYLEAHSVKEIFLGFLIGVTTQLLAFGIAYFFL